MEWGDNMPCLVETIKKNTDKKIEKLKSEIEVNQADMRKVTEQLSNNNTDGLFELAEIVSDLQEAVFEIANILSGMKGGDEDGETLHQGN